MSITLTQRSRLGLSRLGYLLVGVGVAIGIFGWVKAAGIVIASGSLGVSLAFGGKGRVERFMPLALALALLALAIALP